MKDHIVGERIIFPGVGYVELAVTQHELGTPPQGKNIAAHKVGFLRIWLLGAPPKSRDARGPGFKVKYSSSSTGTFEIASSLANSRSDFTVHAVGILKHSWQTHSGLALTL